jgi:hypothetical protein
VLHTNYGTWHLEDVLDTHPHDAEERGIAEGDCISRGSPIGAKVSVDLSIQNFAYFAMLKGPLNRSSLQDAASAFTLTLEQICHNRLYGARPGVITYHTKGLHVFRLWTARKPAIPDLGLAFAIVDSAVG